MVCPKPPPSLPQINIYETPIRANPILPFPDLEANTKDEIINEKLPQTAEAYASCRIELKDIESRIKLREQLRLSP